MSIAPPRPGTHLKFSSAAEANSYRLKAIVERISFICKGSVRFDPAEFSSLCFSLARGIDYALTISDVPVVANRLTSLFKQTYPRRSERTLQPAIMILAVSIQNACKHGWFQTAEADELQRTTNELFSSFCMAGSMSTGPVNELDVILKVFFRFYPQLNFCSLIVHFEAKAGYEVLMTDFHIPRNLPPEEKIKLFIVQTDNLETSSCLVSPPQVSFLVNGKGVEGRNNVSLENGPQLPTDVTKMLKYGTNIIQSVGYFTGNYLIALAYISKLNAFNAPPPEDYIKPVSLASDADSDLIEGASRITLNCPFSFTRIKVPVKGYSCKHHQCFDYDNFMEMNSRNPSWRCPFCNQPVCCIDLRIDRNMVKILEEVGKDASYVDISADGSWNAIVENNQKKDVVDRATHAEPVTCNTEREPNQNINTIKDAVDLTTEMSLLSDSFINQSDKQACETEDTKPFKCDARALPESLLGNFPSASTILENPDLRSGILSRNSTFASVRPNASALGTLESLLPPVNTYAITSVSNGEPVNSVEASQLSFSSQHMSQIGDALESMQLQLGSSTVSRSNNRPPITRNISRSPVAVQALPVQSQSQAQAQLTNPLKRMRVNDPNDPSSTAPLMVKPLAQIPSGLGMASNNMEPQQNFRTPDPPEQNFRTPDPSLTQVWRRQTNRYAQMQALQRAAGIITPNPISTRAPVTQPRGDGAYRASVTQETCQQLSSLGSLAVSRLPSGMSTDLTTRQIAGTTTELTRDTRLPHEQNWRPTGRMRGSLTGDAYSDALNKYSVTNQLKSDATKMPNKEPGGEPSK